MSAQENPSEVPWLMDLLFPIMFLLKSLLGAAVVLVPGALTASLVCPRGRSSDDRDHDYSVRWLLIAVGWAAGMVPSLSFFLCLATTARVSWWTLLLASLINSAVAIIALRRRHGPNWPTTTHWKRLQSKGAWGVILVAMVLGLTYFLTYDNRCHASESCIYRTAYAAVGLVAPSSDISPEVNLLTSNVEDARLGNTAVLATFLFLFHGFGFRLLYGICGLMLALGGYVLGRWIGGSRWWGFFALFLLPWNPYVASIPQLDENLLALSFSAVLLPFLSVGGGGWGAAGALFGVVATIRHVMLPAFPALLFAAVKSRSGWRGAIWSAAAFAMTIFMESLHHYLALGSVFRFESNSQFPPFEYRFCGFDFTYHGLFNWPFHEQIVRTPHNPFPMFITWPLLLADHLGLLLFATMVFGFFALWWQSRRQWSIWALWSLCVLGGLAVQEGWDILNKMWVIVILMGAFTAWIVAGGQAILRRPLLGVALVTIVMASVHYSAIAIRDWRVPPDERYLQVEPGVAEEDPEILDSDAERLTDLGLLPDLGRLNSNGPFLASPKVTELWDDLLSPGIVFDARPLGWFPREPPPRGPEVTVEIDLSERPFGRQDFVSVSDQPADLIVGSVPTKIDGIKVPWDQRSLIAYAGIGDELTAVVLFYDESPDAAFPAELQEKRKERILEQRGWALGILLGEEEDVEVGRQIVHPSPKLRLRLPSGGLSLALERSIGADRILLYKGLVSPEGVSLALPFEPWDN
jgi:hypothetical protein